MFNLLFLRLHYCELISLPFYFMQRSYVFQNRPLTPPRHIKQEEYSDQLCDQVEAKTAEKMKRVRDNEFLERLEQVQLAEE